MTILENRTNTQTARPLPKNLAKYNFSPEECANYYEGLETVKELKPRYEIYAAKVQAAKDALKGFEVHAVGSELWTNADQFTVVSEGRSASNPIDHRTTYTEVIKTTIDGEVRITHFSLLEDWTPVA